MATGGPNGSREDQPGPRLRPAEPHETASAHIAPSLGQPHQAPREGPLLEERDVRWWKNGRCVACVLGGTTVTILGCCCGLPIGLFWLVFFATRPAYPVGEVEVTAADGTVHKLILLHADPLVRSPFDGPEGFVEFQNHRQQLHGRNWASGEGRVYVSPDRRYVMVASRFKGGESARLIFDLTTGEVETVDEPASSYH